MPIRIITNFFKRIFTSLFSVRRELKLGFYGPPNAGKTTLANRICKDWIGEEVGTVSKIPHETREVIVKEAVKVEYKGRSIMFKLIDTPGIATKVDYENFLKYGLSKKEARKRAEEATRGVIEAIKWLDDMDVIVVVLDACENPYSQVNITIIGNIAARKIPMIIAANKIDLKRANLKAVEAAFPEYEVVGISAKYGKNMEEFYETLFNVIKGMKRRKKG
ncbi:MAG: Era-like GTP-binding protein [Candidatus Pacearchaeota archaeon]